MKPYTPFVLITLLFSSPALAINEGVRDCNNCASNCSRAANGGKLITYNPENKRTLSANMKGYVDEAEKIGAPALSCIRTQGCQNELRSCYARLGCHGRAAKKSSHTDGTACDWSSYNKQTKQAVRPKLNRIIGKYHDITAWHHGKEGGAIHDYTGSYSKSKGELVAPRGAQAPKGSEVAEEEQNPKKPAPERIAKPIRTDPVRQPSSGSYQQQASGKYKCPRGLRSICGSTRDTRWCENWVKRGNTPGCHN